MLLTAINTVFAQVQPYGKIDTADLKLTICDFEPGANAMVLFDKGDIEWEHSIDMVRHKRIKIFNEHGKGQADIRFDFVKKGGIENISDVQAQTINLNGNVIEYTPVDKILKSKVDKYTQSLIISFPNVKPGSVIEFKYKWSSDYEYFPLWLFQDDIPVRYSELNARLRGGVKVYVQKRQNFLKETKKAEKSIYGLTTKCTWAMEKVPSFTFEPYMPANEGLQRLQLFRGYTDSWLGIGERLIRHPDFGLQLNIKLDRENEILYPAKAIKDSVARMAYIFDHVKNTMVWNKVNAWYTETGVKGAWINKKGNSSEINLILCNLLGKAGIKAFPTVISTPDNGRIEVDYPSLLQFNKTVVCVPIDSVSYFILDATDKHNLYNEIPYEALGLSALAVNTKVVVVHVKDIISGKDTLGKNPVRARLFTIQSPPAREAVIINAEIKPDGKMTGSASITSVSHNRTALLKRKDLHEKTYTEHLKFDDNSLSIKSLKFENLETDTLPLIQNIDFDLSLTQSDDKYIYFNANLFSGFRVNPFLSEIRNTDIEFKYKNTSVIGGTYKIPENYTIETVPKTVSIKTEDNGISIRRMVAYENNTIAVRYFISHNRLIYSKEEYPALKKFYKKMFEILNEPMVLKKI